MDSCWAIITEAFFTIFFIFGVGTFEEIDLRVAFESEDMGTDSIEEPAVVGDNDGATGEVIEAFFEGA